MTLSPKFNILNIAGSALSLRASAGIPAANPEKLLPQFKLRRYPVLAGLCTARILWHLATDEASTGPRRAWRCNKQQNSTFRS